MTINKLSYLRSILLCAVTLAFLSLGYLFLTTQKGLEIATQLAKQTLPGTLNFIKINGCLLGPIQIKDLSYKDTDTSLTISSAKFDWHWSALLQGQLNLGALSIDKLILVIKEKSTTASKKNAKNFQLPTFFKHIQLNSIDIKQAFISYAANTLSVSGSLHQQWNINWQLNISKLENFLPASHGKLFLKGKIKGNYSSPNFYFSFPKTNLRYLTWKLNQIQGSFDVAVLDKNKWLLDLKANQLKNGSFSVNPIQINLSGNLHPFSLHGNVSGFQLSRKTEMGRTDNLKLSSSQIEAKLSASGLETKLLTPSNNANQLNATIQLPHYNYGHDINSKQTIQGNIQLRLKNLTPLSIFIPSLKNPQGILEAQLNLSGLLFSPSINLALIFKNGSAQIPRLGLYLKNITLLFHTENRLLQGSGSVDSGKGTLTFQSKTQLKPTEFPTSINLNGNNLEISHTREYKIIASPVLQIKTSTRHMEITGVIDFPKAKINLDEDSFNDDILSSDVVFVQHKKATPVLPFTYNNNVKIQLGNSIRFNYQGLQTKITGNLAVKQISDHPILATGQLSLMGGKYTYYGQSLTLQPHSLLSFANSPIANPNIDITANKRVWVSPLISPTNTSSGGGIDTSSSGLGSQNFISSALQTRQPIQTTVGVHLQGYLANPQITLYANPSSAISSQLEILSYLITGQPSNQLSAASIQLLLSAATQAGGKKTGFDHLLNKAQKKIGIDQITIGANPIFNPNSNKLEQNTSLIIGKNFSPRLNVSYSLGLLDPISILQINYLLNKNLSLQSTNSNFSNGIDLLYKVEKH